MESDTVYKTNPQYVANDIERIKEYVEKGNYTEASYRERHLWLWTLAAIATDCCKDPKECARLCFTTDFMLFKRTFVWPDDKNSSNTKSSTDSAAMV